MIEMRWLEVKESERRTRLDLQYRYEITNVMGTKISWSDWTSVRRVAQSEDDQPAKPDDQAE